MQRSLFIIVVIAVLALLPLVNAQEARLVTPEVLPLYAGPSETYERASLMNISQPYAVVARNQLGNWVQITHRDEPEISGWTLTGNLLLNSEMIDLEAVPVTDLPDAVAAQAQFDGVPDLLYTTPIIPHAINVAMLREVYYDGQKQGNNAYGVVKIGDCNTASGQFLSPISAERFDPGPYAYLTETVDEYAASFERTSIAARNGFNVSSIFDSFWATSDLCDPGESPLACEYRHNPSTIAFIMFGQNDVLVLNRDQYRDYLRQVVDETLDHGIIPVLSTFTNNPENTDNWDQILALNVITIEVAVEHDIPLINFWLAARSLPDYGIAEDYAHLTVSGGTVSFAQGREAEFGLTLYNLAVLNMLDILSNDVIQLNTQESSRSG
jgi:hypothetical protein